MTMDRTFIDQVTDMQREVRTLRATNAEQANTIGLLKKQYDDLAEDYKMMLEESRGKLHQAYTDRDVAERNTKEIEGTLRVVSAQIVEFFNARAGNAIPPPTADVKVARIENNTPSQRVLRESFGQPGQGKLVRGDDEYVDRETGSDRRYD